MNIITSSQNQRIKDIKALKTKKYREEKKQFFIEGLKFMEEALKAKANIDCIILAESFIDSAAGKELQARAQKEAYEIHGVTDKVFKEISDTEHPQGVFAVLKMKEFLLEDVLRGKSFIVILDCVQDPGNMGTVIRTADAAGAEGVILSRGCVDLYNPKVLRATMGSIFHVPVFHAEVLSEVIEAVKSQGYKIFASHLRGNSNHFDVDFTGPSAVVIGNEAQGISDAISEAADTLVKIPMPGKSESLNASIAAGVLMYEVVRQRLQKNIK